MMADNDTHRDEIGFQVYVMCEIPSSVILAKAFAQRFDGLLIDNNDLTQLTLGVDHDSVDLVALFNEQGDAVGWMVRNVIASAREVGAHVGLCSQAPSGHLKSAAFLVECGTDSISVSPGSFIAVKRSVAVAESTATEAP